jgi:Phage tail fiber repeats
MQITESGLKKPESQDIEPIQSNVDILDEHLRDTDIHVNAAKIAEIEIPEELTQIDSTDTNKTMWGKIKKSISEVMDHVDKVASETTLGHIKIGTGLQMEEDVASVKIANDLTTTDATTTLSAAMGAELNGKLLDHEEKVASETDLGHIKIGTGLQMTDDVANVKIVNNLTTTDSEAALSAAMGKSLNESKAPNNHASTITTYGLGNVSNYGHVKLSDSFATSSGGASEGIGASSKAVVDAYNTLNTSISQKAPINHATTATTYGVGNTTNFGHVKLSDNYTSSAGVASTGVGASSAAVANCYTVLNNKIGSGVRTQVSQTVSTSSSATVYIKPEAVAGFNFIGVVGWNVSGSYASYASIHECFYNGENVKISLRSIDGKALSVTVEVKLLYLKA